MADLDRLRKLCQLMVTANPGDHFHALGLQFTRIEKGNNRRRLLCCPTNLTDAHKTSLQNNQVIAVNDLGPKPLAQGANQLR